MASRWLRVHNRSHCKHTHFMNLSWNQWGWVLSRLLWFFVVDNLIVRISESGLYSYIQGYANDVCRFEVGKFAGSIADGVIGICQWRTHSGHTSAMGLNQSLKEMSTRDVSWGEGGRCVGLTTLPPSCADCLVVSASWNPQGLSRPVMGLF
jgi:hypothetical protein